MTDLTMGVFGSSFKENEYRLPIHPVHLDKIDPELRKRIYIEQGYGSKFGVTDDDLQGFAGVLTREELFETCRILLLPKPCAEDFPYFRDGHILWGWPHCVQGPGITQQAIDKKMTMIAWEEMHLWKQSGGGEPAWQLHTFHKNNELAGYCSVMHALQLAGFTGHYGPAKKAAILSFGSTAQGAAYALQALGILQTTVYKQRPALQLAYQIPTLQYRQFKRSEPGSDATIAENEEGQAVPIISELAQYDIIVNCILQNTDAPITFVGPGELEKLKRNALIIDVSCDEGMGFDFAKPTTFEEPTFVVDGNITYYAVDHSPSYLWNSATYEISTALMPYVATVMGGPEAWDTDLTIRKSIEIQDGQLLNPKIASFQKRETTYPYATLPDA